MSDKSSAPNSFGIARRRCMLGVKAFQNLRAAVAGFERMLALTESEDHLLVSSVFTTAIVRYAKPFLVSRAPEGKLSYSAQWLKDVDGFDMTVHDHIVEVRNKLAAHDDIEAIEPRIMIHHILVKGTDREIPIVVYVSNKCLGYPKVVATVDKFHKHAQAAFIGIGQILCKDIKNLREISLHKPEERKEYIRFHDTMGPTRIPASGSRIAPLDASRMSWLQNPEPDYSEVHDGFLYESLTVNQQFYGPERIEFADGSSVIISP